MDRGIIAAVACRHPRFDGRMVALVAPAYATRDVEGILKKNFTQRAWIFEGIFWQ
jgi:hypothetical protein